jgi:hypothetical protein
MESTNQNLKELLAEKLADLYLFHKYNVTAEDLIYIVNCLNKRFPIDKTNEKTINEFIELIECGYFGVFYYQPTCIASFWNKHFIDYDNNGNRKMVY